MYCKDLNLGPGILKLIRYKFLKVNKISFQINYVVKLIRLLLTLEYYGYQNCILNNNELHNLFPWTNIFKTIN
jgi:hypothetical protein